MEFFIFDNGLDIYKIKDTTNMDIAIQSISEEEVEMLSYCRSREPEWLAEFQGWVNLLKNIPKYRKSKTRFKLKCSTMKQKFIDSWLIELGWHKRNAIEKIVKEVKKIDWELRETNYQRWKWNTFEGKHRYMDFCKKYYEETGRVPYTLGDGY